MVFSVYNPPEHIQQQPIYSTTGPTYTSWSTIQPQTPNTIMSPTINCWSLTSSPPPPHQITAQTTPNQSPSHQVYQPITNITNLTYPSYYSQEYPCSAYQNTDYLPSMVNNGTDITYTQIGSDRTTPIVYQNDGLDKVAPDYEAVSTQNQQPESPTESTGSTARAEWVPQTHLSN